MKTRFTTAAVAIAVVGTAASVLMSGPSLFDTSKVVSAPSASASVRASATASPTSSPSPTSSATPTVPTLDDFISPKSGKYLGISLVNGEAGLSAYDQTTGTPADVQEEFLNFGQIPALSEIFDAYQQHALTVLSWQPVDVSLASIDAGHEDSYITALAGQIAESTVPVGIDFAPEFNGNWETWGAGGPEHATPAQYVAAWQRIHDLFVAAGATNVIWIWAPNVINPAPKVDLALYWPGPQFVDWVGMSAYWTSNLNEDSWATLIMPTEDKIEAITNDPIVITETGAEQGAEKIPWITDMLTGLATDPHVLGMIYFNSGTAQGKRADWTFTNNPADLAAWQAGAHKIVTVPVNGPMGSVVAAPPPPATASPTPTK